MLFKFFYSDDSSVADTVMDHYQTDGYESTMYDRKNCATFDIIPNEIDFTKTRIVIKNERGNEIYDEMFSVWRHYLVVFEDNTVITLRRNFYPGEYTKRNRDKMDAFIDAIREKLNQQNGILIQDDDEDFVI